MYNASQARNLAASLVHAISLGQTCPHYPLGLTGYNLYCNLRTFVITYLLSYLPMYLPTYLPTYPPTYLPTYLPIYLGPKSA